MSQPTAVPVSQGQTPSIPFRELAPWALFFALVGAVLVIFAGVDLQMFGIPGGAMAHEFVHDGRHLLGFPCH